MVKANAPFSFMEKKAVRDFLEVVSPGFPPELGLQGLASKLCFPPLSRKTVSRKYITKLYKEEMARFAASKSGSMCTMGVDGWSTEDNIPVVGISLDNQLVDLVDTQTDRHMGRQTDRQTD